MLYQIPIENNRVNDTTFSSKNINSPAAISIKKTIDISSKCLKFSSQQLHFFKSSLPIISFVLSLIGLLLKSYAEIKDKRKPMWLRALSLLVLGVTAAIVISLFVLSVQFPPITLALNFAMVAIGVMLQTVDFMHALLSVVVCKFNVTFPSKKDNTDKIVNLNSQRAMLFKKQTSIVSALNHETEPKKIDNLKGRLQQIQKTIIKTETKIQQLKHLDNHRKDKYQKSIQSFFGACFGLSTCLGGAILSIVGLTIAVGNPPLGIALIGLGLVFDSLVLSRKANKWRKNKQKTKNNQQELHVKCQKLSRKSVELLNNEHRH